MYKINIEKETLDNKYFRKVLFTNKKQQLAVMNLSNYSDIGFEKHAKISQFIRVESGSGVALFTKNGKNVKTRIKEGSVVIINPGMCHNIIAGKNGLKLYTNYSPPNHPSDCIQITK